LSISLLLLRSTEIGSVFVWMNFTKRWVNLSMV